MRERHGQVIETRTVAAGVTEIAIEATEPRELVAKAGQFLSLRLPDGTRRSYSITSRSGRTSRVELLLKTTAVDGGTAQLVDMLVPGAAISFFGPMGYFLYEVSDRPYQDVFAATGVGITAIMPMIEEALAASDGPTRVVLLWGLRNAADVVFADRLDALASDARFEHRFVFSGEGQGYITPHVHALANDLTAPRFYLCGHGQMVVDVVAGLPADATITTEVFYAATRRPPTEEPP